MRWRLATPGVNIGAIAIFEVTGPIEVVFACLGLAPIAVGKMQLRRFGSIDRGLVAVVGAKQMFLMPHGGREILSQIGIWLTESGIVQAADEADEAGGVREVGEVVGVGGACERFPEADSPFEAALCDALARAMSPAAIDLLLAQPALWRSWCAVPENGCSYPPSLATLAPDEVQSTLLNRLLEPPLVVAVGASNIGKSTFLNRLAGTTVAAVADAPGTTRDHVGALVDLDGLVVRYVDTPGKRADADSLERDAGRIAARLLPQAACVLCLGDPDHGPPEAPEVATGAQVLRIGLRSDLGPMGWEADGGVGVVGGVSALTGAGMDEVARLIRQRLVPDWALHATLPWRFW